MRTLRMPAWNQLRWIALLGLAFSLLNGSPALAEKYYKLTEEPIASKDGSKPKPPEASKPVDPNRFKEFIVVDVSSQKVEYYKDGDKVFSTPASTGTADNSTRPGVYKISNKHKKWTSTIYNVPMPNFLRFNGSAVGIHAGYLPGFPASHGCIRIPEDASEYLFENISVGTPVVVQGTAPDKEWIKSQYKVKRIPSSASYSSKAGKKQGEEWKPPYPIIGTSWNKAPELKKVTEEKTPPAPVKKKKTAPSTT